MPRGGLTPLIVVREAADLADEIGYDALTLTALASRLNVAVPSLYKHVASLEDVRRSVALMAIQELGAAIRAVIDDGAVQRGRHGPDRNMRALAMAYRRFALDHPGRYAATVRAAPAGDLELRAASDATVQPVLELLEARGLKRDDPVHAARGLRAALHGFAALENAGGFGLPQDVEHSFERMVQTIDDGLREWIDSS